MRKDVTEEQLEKLVFGDDAGFRSAVRSHRPADRELALTHDVGGEDEDVQSEDGEGMGGVADVDVCRLHNAGRD